jgi:hypothetical protein
VCAVTAAAGDKLTGSFEADGCNMLLLSYSLVPHGSAAGTTDPSTRRPLPLPPSMHDGTPAAVGLAAAGAAGVQAVGGLSTTGSSYDAVAAASASILPASSSSSSSRALTLQLPFWLEFSSVGESSPAAASVRVTFLGTFVGRIGQAVTLSWQLARIASADIGPDAAAGEQGTYNLISLDGSRQQQQQQQEGMDAGYDELMDSSSSSRQLAAGGSARQYGSSADTDELLCYELVFGQHQQKQEGTGASNDISSSSRATSGTAASAATAAAAADMGGLSSGANAALLWGVSGAAPIGVVRLGRAPGSLAVVEVMLTPRAVGRLAAPQLVLKSPGGNQVELFEGGSGPDCMLTISR